MTHLTDRALNELVDGTLPEEERTAAEEHLRDCPACRSERERLAALLEGARRLPRALEPGRDLWPEIAGRIGSRGAPRGRRPEESAGSGAGGRRSFRARPGWLAAAAVLLVAATAGITALLVSGPEEAPETELAMPERAAPSVDPDAPGSAMLPAQFRRMEEEYRQATAELAFVLEERRQDLAPETVEVLEDNLRIIDRAIRESRAALAADTGRIENARLLAGAYQSKLDLLRRAVRIPVAQPSPG